MLEWQLEIDLSSVVSISVVDLRNRAAVNSEKLLARETPKGLEGVKCEVAASRLVSGVLQLAHLIRL